MRDRARQRAAAVAKSHRATPEELREAAKRVKEIEVELGKLDIQPETKVGETRQQRYARILRLRSMREEFQGDRALEVHNPPRSMAVALIMTVASFLLCAFCVGGSYFALQIVNQKPDPSATVQNFWDDMEHKNYVDLHDNYLSPTLRVELDQARLSAEASQADNDFGQVSSYKLLKQVGDMQNTETYTFAVVRGDTLTYQVTLVVTFHGSSWGVNDLGAAVDPTLAGIPAPTPAPTVAPTSTSTTSATGEIGTARFA